MGSPRVGHNLADMREHEGRPQASFLGSCRALGSVEMRLWSGCTLGVGRKRARQTASHRKPPSLGRKRSSSSNST